MIRAVKENDLSAVMQIWLDINIKAHSFISKHYWMDNYDMVKKILPQAEIYVYENNGTKEIEGFIGLTDNYIAGLFVKEDMQSKGIGKQLLNYAKGIKSNMYLSVYNKNIRAIQFYQREQFVVQSENTDDNTNEKELVMAWSRQTNSNLTKECDFMKKAIVSSVIAIVLGYLGSALGYEIMNWPQLGPILAIVVMGSAILTSLEKDK